MFRVFLTFIDVYCVMYQQHPLNTTNVNILCALTPNKLLFSNLRLLTFGIIAANDTSITKHPSAFVT